MVARSVQCLLVFALLLGKVWANPTLNHNPESHPLAAVSELSSRLAARARDQEARLPVPLPTPQDIETIKKVAQILVMLGEQVIPTVIGEPPAPSANCEKPAVVDVPTDPVDDGP